LRTVPEREVDVDAADLQIVALILSHNAPESLRRCLDSIGGQSMPPAAVLVVDNASTPPVEVAVPDRTPPVTVVRSETNTGPAGGYAQALEEFLASPYELAWVLDDDMRPEVHCLERLRTEAAKVPGTAFVFPVSQQTDGSYGVWPSWCGFLVSHAIVEKVGVPRADLFWWAEDTEYLQARIPDAGYERRVVKDAVVYHDEIRKSDALPMWKYYYEARNMLWVHLHVKRRIGRYPRSVAKLIGRALFREREERLRRMAVISRGIWDGARGNLGVTFPIGPLQERSSSPKDTSGG
jgi:GT2 family glycosyltransferase